MALKKFFNEQKFDYVQYHTPNASFYASVASKMSKIPLRVYGQWGIRYVTFSGVRRFIFKTIEKINPIKKIPGDIINRAINN